MPRAAQLLRALGLASWLIQLPGCGPEPTLFAPVARLVEADPAAGHAVIERDQRPVLRAFPATRIHHQSLSPRDDRSAVLRLAVAPELREARRLVLQPFVRQGTTAGYHRPLPAQVAPVHGNGAGSWVDLPGRLPPGRVDLFVEARELPEQPPRPLETRPLEIPPRARLDFAIGILEAAWDQGPVHFEVQACDEAGSCNPIFGETVDPRSEAGGSWRERSVALESLAGARRRFRFETRYEGPAESGFSFPCWGDPTLLAPRARSSQERNLILISIDTLRADHLDVYGYPRETAPFLAKLAAEGSVFEAVVSAATTTAPSHMTIFTSLQPSVHGLRGNAGSAQLAASTPTLSESLHAQGFATGAVSEGGGIGLGRGFDRGFDTYIENPASIPHRPGTQSAVSFPRALDWIQRVGDRRFFLFLHTYEVHGPYQPPAEYESFFRDEGPELAAPAGLAPTRSPVHYDREIRYVDDELRRFVAGLEAAGQLDDTLLVVTSDHGEEFLEHGAIGHGSTPYQEVLEVPLIFRGPGVPARRRIDAPVGLVDLMPTLLELLGVPVPAGVSGRSFAELVSGAAADVSWRERPLFSEAWFAHRRTPAGRLPVAQPTLAVRVGDRKLIRFREGDSFRYEYYDLASDPGEKRDLYAQQPHQAADLRELLDSYEAAAVTLRRSLVPVEAAEPLALDPDREQSLRALGYLE